MMFCKFRNILIIKRNSCILLFKLLLINFICIHSLRIDFIIIIIIIAGICSSRWRWYLSRRICKIRKITYFFHSSTFIYLFIAATLLKDMNIILFIFLLIFLKFLINYFFYVTILHALILSIYFLN